MAHPLMRPREHDVVFRAQLMDHQADMLQAFEDDDYHKLLDSVLKNEDKFAQERRTSRILNQKKSWQDEAFHLLLQLDKRILRSALSNTLAYRLQTDLHEKLDGPDSTIPAPDPAIYVNCIAGADGKGIEVGEFEKFLKIIEVAAGVKSHHEAGPWYSEARVIARINTAYRDVINTGSRNTGSRNPDFFEGLDDGDERRLRASAQSFCNFQRDHVVGRAGGLTHIALYPEVGLALNPYKRCEDHSKMIPGLSPWLFKLVHLAARSIFPERRFHLHQYILFRLTTLPQVAIGETLASLMCSSYLSIGGVNVAQAGINLGQMGAIKGDEWDKIYNRFMGSRFYRWYTTNLKDYETFLNARNERIEKQISRLEKQIELDNLQEKNKAETARQDDTRSSLKRELEMAQSSLDHGERHVKD